VYSPSPVSGRAPSGVLSIALALLAGFLGVAGHAAAPRVTIDSIWIDGIRQPPADRLLAVPAGADLKILVACDPPQADARFRYQVEGGAWSDESAEPLLKIEGLRAGAGRVAIAAAGAGGSWSSEVLTLDFRVEEEAVSGRTAFPIPRWTLGAAAIAVGLALLVIYQSQVRRRPRVPGPDPRHPQTAAAHREFAGRDGTALPAPDSIGAAGPVAREETTPMNPPLSRPRPAGAPAGSQDAASPHGIVIAELETQLRKLRARLLELHSSSLNLRRMNRELQERCELLERSNESLRALQKRKDEALAALVHDIKNPAAAIQTIAEVLQSYDLSAMEQQKFVADILTTSSRILRLTQEMSVAMVEEIQDVPLSVAKASMREVISQVANWNRPLAHNKAIKIALDLPVRLPDVEMDAARMEEVVDNLLSNAIKFSKPSTSIRVEARVAGDHMLVAVSDTGPGLTEADLQKAFQVGKVLSARSAEGAPSSGLGLWIVRRNVEAHGGTVLVRSDPGAGATFTVKLPLGRKPAAAG